ncbi:MAG: sigma-70 family RNA polymerase sigma factor [Bacteroidota bacterium]
MIFAILPNEQVKNDVSLLERISRRDSSALSELYDKHSTLLYSIIMRILKEKEETEDVLQEVFVNVWERAEMYDEQLGNPGAWLARIARNRAVDRLRSKNYRTRSKESDIDQHHDYFTADASSNPEHRAILSSQQEEILIALTSLSKDQKDLIEFAYFRGFTQSELADHFKLPLGTVKTRMRTAMSILRQKLRHHLA